MQLPQYILDIFAIYEANGYEAFVVGGCVRDAICKRNCHDYDVITNALPQETIALFQQIGLRILPTGFAHGTLTLIYQEHFIEITTYRKEDDYIDHRRPANISFTKSIYEDLKRRDFTINAIAYHPVHGLIDPFCGIKDIHRRTIRCVGDPNKRMEEDALRILRALRFSAQLSFTIEEKTWQAILTHAMDIDYVSKERIQAEFNQYLCSDKPNALHFLRAANVLELILPEMQRIYDAPQPTPWHAYDIFTHTDIALNHSKGYSLEKKLAIVFHDLGKPLCEGFDEKGIVHYHGHAEISKEIAKQRLKQLHYSNTVIKYITTLIAFHDYYVCPKRKVLRRFLSKLDNDIELALDILDIQLADNHAKHPKLQKELIENVLASKALLLQIQKEQDMIQRKDLAVNGHDLIALGYQGADIKKALEMLYQIVIEDPSQNTKENLLSLLNTSKS